MTNSQLPEQSRRILITGGSGTLGYNVVRAFARDNSYELFIPLRSPESGCACASDRIHVLRADLSSASDLQTILAAAKPHVIVHCAASGVRPTRPAWFDMTTFNVEATLRLFEASLPFDCHFVYISTGLVYGEQSRPMSETDPIESLHPYGASKAAADSLLRAAASEFDRKLTLLRPFSFTGLRDCGGRLFPSLLEAASAGSPLPLSPSQQIRDFCSVNDIARGVKYAVERSDQECISTINLGSGRAEPLCSLIGSVADQLGLDIQLQFGARPYHPKEPMYLVADITKAENVLGWQPTTNLAFAVWELAQLAYPGLRVNQPAEHW